MSNALVELQRKCGVIADGIFGPNTYRAARRYFELSNIEAAHFFGQCAHESANFTVFSENLNYSVSGLTRIFRKYFPNIELASQYARKPMKIANRVYANRMGNGPESSGDGWKFRGRGAIQLTGRNNYTLFARYMDDDSIVFEPDQVASKYGFESAMFFFETNNLFSIARQGINDTVITRLTRRINGGTHGLQDRINKTKRFATWN